jgi:hypothetical protein
MAKILRTYLISKKKDDQLRQLAIERGVDREDLVVEFIKRGLKAAKRTYIPPKAYPLPHASCYEMGVIADALEAGAQDADPDDYAMLMEYVQRLTKFASKMATEESKDG